MTRFLTAVFVSVLAPPACASDESANVPAGVCHLGAYDMSDGSRMVLQPSWGDDLRYRFENGASGRLYYINDNEYESGAGWAVRQPVTLRVTFGACEAGVVRFKRDGAEALSGKRIPLPVKPVSFRNDGETFYGELMLPLQRKPRAVVVVQYGAGRESAVINNYVQYLLPLHDIAVFVFDKRGTGRSSGEFNAHIRMLADDMVAAVEAVRRLPEVKDIPLGVMGESQGGWVAPLAASRTPVDFVIASYALAVSMIEEDRQEVAQSLRMQGFGKETQAKAEQLHRAAVRVMLSRFNDGLDELKSLKARYRDEPWFTKVEGDFTRTLALASAEEMPKLRALFDFPYDIAYEPMPVIASLDVPQLWLLAGKDTEAPHEATLENLRGLQKQGLPIDVTVFEDADHGMIVVEGDGPDRRLAGRTSEEYFERLVDWIGERGIEKGAARDE